MANEKLSASEVRRLAVAASCDPRTVEKVLRGEPVRGMARTRALAALKAAGVDVAPADAVEEGSP